MIDPRDHEIGMLLRQFGGSGCLDEGLEGKNEPIGAVRFQCQQVAPCEPVGASTAERIAWDAALRSPISLVGICSAIHLALVTNPGGVWLFRGLVSRASVFEFGHLAWNALKINARLASQILT
jgi:hypothetical protein